MSDRPHSAEQFTSARDHWWNADYLDVIERRFDLRSCRRVLELGAGVGHWTEIMIGRCAPDAKFTLIDREPEWVATLKRRFAHLSRVTVAVADVTDLPTFDQKFDLVTCQTLLMHVADVGALLRSVKHCLVPGGLLLVVEPNNLANRLGVTPSSGLTPVEFGALAALWWAFEIGRQRRGLGQEWIAEELPGLIATAGFVDVTASQNDRLWLRYPPYDSPDQVAIYGTLSDALAEATDLEPREEVASLALAGGLDEATFERGWTAYEKLTQHAREQLLNGTFSSAGLGSLGVFGARAPLGS